MFFQKKISISDFDYSLPDEKIALHPLTERNKSKLLVYKNNKIIDDTFANILDHLDRDCMLVFNNSKVIHARLLVTNSTGAQIEIFCLEPLSPTTELTESFQQTGELTWKCFIGHARKWKEDIHFIVKVDQKEVSITARKGGNLDGAFEVTFRWDDPVVTFAEWMESYGKIPLPPYIKRVAEEEDSERYQTVYALHDGSVAAPTAGLHFSEYEMAALKERGILHDYVTLHVGAGTFKPVSSETVEEHFMHREQVIIDTRMINALLDNLDKKVIAVGTTVTRTLESLFIMGAKLRLGLENPFHVEQWEYYDNEEIKDISPKESLSVLADYLQKEQTTFLAGTTQLMITPAYQLKIVKGIITNFHQPKSTLLLLISAILGDNWHKVYRHALDNDYRFLSYGDANLYFS
ncbi:MAG: S-adenosylmethionine:tRNA ribosyltransferase-isomerase [Bacteroidales bacterium]|jgi:S-adenosylmethionine:tRNA ribosyltransferase-isomerase|nr:S-adenosylmethionine:tRNA ribosyltransferase-isomerase [Bacteroidales bacterium]